MRTVGHWSYRLACWLFGHPAPMVVPRYWHHIGPLGEVTRELIDMHCCRCGGRALPKEGV